MTIRRWFYLMVGLCAVSLYVSVVNVFNPSGALLYVLGGLAVAGILYVGSNESSGYDRKRFGRVRYAVCAGSRIIWKGCADYAVIFSR